MKLMLIGLIWQFVLSMIILYREESNIRISTIRRWFWLNNPISPRTGQKDNRLWWLIIPLIILVAAVELEISPFLNGIWTKVLPFLAGFLFWLFDPGFGAGIGVETVALIFPMIEKIMWGWF